MNYRLDKDGFQVVPAFLSKTEIENYRAALTSLALAPGHRNLMQGVPEILELALSEKVLNLLTGFLGNKPFPVRSIFFDKTPAANWLVPWHQDLSIAIRQKVDLPGYGTWSIKDGVPHVQPPVAVLEAMLTVRFHLDDCDESNGALRVMPGSHRLGRLDAATIANVRARKLEVICCAQAGDALLMRPLLLHASAEAHRPAHRRVIHLEYATAQLPGGLAWAEALSKRENA